MWEYLRHLGVLRRPRSEGTKKAQTRHRMAMERTQNGHEKKEGTEKAQNGHGKNTEWP